MQNDNLNDLNRNSGEPPPARSKPVPDEKDNELGELLILKITKCVKPAREDISQKSAEFKFWIARWELIDVKDGVLCYYWQDSPTKAKWRVCIPKQIKPSILWYLHDARTAGHMGIKKTWEKAKLCPYYWYKMQQTVKDFVNKCDICGERKNMQYHKKTSSN